MSATSDIEEINDSDSIRIHLLHWGLEGYFPNFEAGGYDSLEVFYDLINPKWTKELEKLIPMPGHRVKFLKKLSDIINESSPDCQVQKIINQDSGKEIVSSQSGPKEAPKILDVSLQSDNMGVSSQSDNDSNSVTGESISGNSTVEKQPQAANSRKRPFSDDSGSESSPKRGAANLRLPVPCQEIENILRSSATGRCLLALAKREKYLPAAIDQDHIARLLVEHALGQSVDFGISRERFINLADQIVSLFPEEEKSSFFVPYSCENGRRCLAKGKLISQYQRLRRELRKAGLLVDEKDHVSGDKEGTEITGDLKKKLKYLEKEVDEWDVIKAYWKDTADVRTKALQHSNDGDVADYFNTYPALKERLGYELLEIDFKHLYPDHGLNGFANWEAFLNTAETALRNHEPKCKQLQDNILLLDDLSPIPGTRDLIILLSLGFLDTVVTVAKKKRTEKGKGKGEDSKAGATWRPPHVEMQEGFISQISSVGKIEKFAKDRVDKLYDWKLKVQPYVLVCGSSVEDIDASYVLIDKVKYLMSSPQKALDVCFKAIHATHASYSKESHRLWMLVQKKLYELDTEFDDAVKDPQLPRLLRKFS